MLAPILALFACLFFVLAGQAFISLLGIEDDESLFAAPLLRPQFWSFALKIGHRRAPLMVMTYIGTVKTAFYAVLFRLFSPGVWSVREPMLLAGGASIWVFYLLLRRTAGRRAAVLGAVLLASNPLYLLTSCFDWGPVALQHLLLLGAALLLVRFSKDGGEGLLASGFFLAGLATWDKALAVWMISGAMIAAVAVFPRQILALMNRRRVLIAVLCFTLGTLPLVIFNLKTDWSTFRGNVRHDSSDVQGKARMLINTANGHGLFGYLTAEDWQTPRPREPRDSIERASARVAAISGHPRYNLMFYATIFALLLVPLAAGVGLRSIMFCVITMAIAWGEMATNAGTGTSVHHTILLWPLPEWTVAVSLAAASRWLGRAGIAVLAAILSILAGSNLLVTNEYHFMMARDGGSVSWSDAIFPLALHLESVPARVIYCVDWGIVDSLRLISRGRLPLYEASPGMPEAASLASPDNLLVGLFVGRTPSMEIFQGNNAKLLQLATAQGWRRDDMTVISDSFGRPTFEVYRFTASPAAP